MEIKVLDLALAVIAIVMIIVGYQIARLGSHVRDSLSRLDRMIEHINQIAPRIDRVVENTNRELETLHSATVKADQVAGRVDEVTAEVRSVSLDLVDQARHLVDGLRHLSAAVTGVRVGVQTLRDRSSQ